MAPSLYAIPIILISCGTRLAACLRGNGSKRAAASNYGSEQTRAGLGKPLLLVSVRAERERKIGEEEGGTSFVGQGVTPLNLFRFSFVYFSNNIKLR